MSLRQGLLIDKIQVYLKNRGRENFAARLPGGFCYAQALVFCYYMSINNKNEFYNLLRKANFWMECNDEVSIAIIDKIRQMTVWQKANEKFQAIAELMTEEPEQTERDKIQNARLAHHITLDEAHILLSALMPDDPMMEKLLNAMKGLQWLNIIKGDFASAGAKLELIRNIDKNSIMFSEGFETKSEFETVMLLPKDMLKTFISKLPIDRYMILGTGRHAIPIVDQGGMYHFFESNDHDETPETRSSELIKNSLMSATFKEHAGTHLPVSIEIFSKKNHTNKNYDVLKDFCDRYQNNDDAKYISTQGKQGYAVDGITPLILSLITGFQDTATNLIKNKKGINTCDALGFFPVHYAASFGLIKNLKDLLDKKVDIDERVRPSLNDKLTPDALSVHYSLQQATPLLFACVNEQIETVKFLLENGAKVNASSVSWLTPLMVAIYYGYHELTQFLLANGASLNKNLQILPDVKYQRKNSSSPHSLAGFGAIYIPDYDGFNVAMLAAKQKHKKILLTLIEKGVDLNYSTNTGMTLLHICVLHGMTDIVELILKQKVNINALAYAHFENTGCGTYQRSISPLWLACYLNNTKMVKLLLEHGADPNAHHTDGLQNPYWTNYLQLKKPEEIFTKDELKKISPLWFANKHNNMEMAALILKKKPDLKTEDTLLMYVIINNRNLLMLELLDENGLNINAMSKKDFFLDMSIQQGLPEFTAFFIQKGVVPKLNIKSSTHNLTQAFKLNNKRQLEVISVLLSYMVKNKHHINLPTCLFLHGDKFFILKLYQQLQNEYIKSFADLKLILVAGMLNHAFAHSESFFAATENKKISKIVTLLQKPECDTILKIKIIIIDSMINKQSSDLEIGFFKTLLRFIDDYSVIKRTIEKNNLIENNEIQIKKQRRM